MSEEPRPPEGCVKTECDMTTDVETTDNEAAFFKFMSRHLVALVSDYESYNEDGSLLKAGIGVASGFVIELHDQWYWVTAGHCLKRMDKAIKKGFLKILSGCFMDGFWIDAKFTKEFFPPFAYTQGRGIAVDDMTIGLDFGMILLDDWIKQCFEKNGVVPVTRSNWIKQPTERMQHFRLLGIPENEVGDPIIDGAMRTVNLSPVMVYVHQRDLATIPGAQSADCFAGQIHKDAKLETVHGMSGGPIYGFSQNAKGEWGYHVVALQSRQPPDDKSIIFGCSVEKFAERAHQAIGIVSGAFPIDSDAIDYPLEEFIEHFRELNDSLGTDIDRRREDGRRIVREFMESKYEGFLDRMYRIQRFLWIIWLLDEHASELVERGLVIREEPEFVVSVSGRLLWALHHLVTTRPTKEIANGVSLEQTLAVVAAIEQGEPGDRDD